MRPYDALTDNDLKTIQYYLEIYGATHSAPLSQVLNVWNINKSTLFKAFGKKLRIEKWISIPKDVSSMNRQLSAIYNEYTLWYDCDVKKAKECKEAIYKKTHNDFITDVIFYWVNQNYQREELFTLSRLFNPTNVSLGYIDTISEPGEFHFTSFKATIKNGMKTVKTIQRILNATKYPNMQLFENWRNDINCLSIGNDIQAKLVLSIHPIDFMSMSDNNCNWSSCMSWSHHGSYRGGTLEMMNSNLAIVAYLEAPQTFKLNISENESYVVPNKSWRSLFYVHKDILLSGKSYPYHNEKISFEVLNILRDLVKKNLNWSYQFGIQEYQDMKNLDGNFYIRDFFNTQYDKKKKHHCIFVYTNCMYNDIIESHNPYYYCYRNYIPRSIKLCLSGPPTCICCGKVLGNRETIYDYDDIGSDLICDECECNRRCNDCGNVHYNLKYHTAFGKFCSDSCCSNYVYFPDFNRATSKKHLTSTDYGQTIIFTHSLNEKECQKVKENFPCSWDHSDESVLKFITETKKEYKDKVVIKRIPEFFTNRLFLNLRQYTPDYYKKTYRSVGDLLIFRYDNNNFSSHDQKIQLLEQQIDMLNNRMSLLDYLKEGVID